MRWLFAPLAAAWFSGFPAAAQPLDASQAPETDRAHAVGRQGPQAVSERGDRAAWSWKEPEAPSTELRVATRGPYGWSAPQVLVAQGNPDRVAMDPTGEVVAYVSGATGLASVYIVPFQGGESVQLTNVDLRPGAGRPPGFVPPPHDHSLRFDGPWLRWDSPEGPQQVRWR